MQHKGEIIEQAVCKSGMPISKLAVKLGITRRTVYNIFDNKDVSLDQILEIGKIIHYYFYKDLKELCKLNYSVDRDLDNEESAAFWKKSI